jgi:hypothetical protein
VQALLRQSSLISRSLSLFDGPLATQDKPRDLLLAVAYTRILKSRLDLSARLIAGNG